MIETRESVAGRFRQFSEISTTTAVCRSWKLGKSDSASPLKESPVHFGRNSENSDLVVSTNNYLSKADAQDLIASDRDVPESDARTIKVGGNLSPEVDTWYFLESTAYHRPSGSKANIQPYILQGLVE